MKVKLSEIQVTKLNGTCLMLISQFSRALKAHNGEILRLTDLGVVGQVIAHARKTPSPELRRLCNLLIGEIKAHLAGESSAQTSYSVYQQVDESSPSPDGRWRTDR